MKKMNLVIGIIILFSFINIGLVSASAINNVDLIFDKEYYSVMEDTSLRVGFTIHNRNNFDIKLFAYTECDNDDIVCDYSKTVNISKNSSITSSFYVTGIDDYSSTVRIYLRGMDNQTNGQEIDFSTYIDVVRDSDDSDFEIDFRNYSLCIGKSNELTLEIDNYNQNDFYDLRLESNYLIFDQVTSNPVYLGNDVKQVKYLVTVPKEVLPGTSYDVILRITNDRVSVVNELSVTVTDCPDPIDFSVSGPSVVSYYVNKNDSQKATYTIYNNSTHKKKIFVAESQEDNDIIVKISDREIEILPRSSKTVEITFNVPKEINSGTKEIDLSFFDGLNAVYKKVRLQINPEYKINTRILQGNNVTLPIGRSVDLMLVIENNGDLYETFDILTNVSGDITLRTRETNVTVLPKSNYTLPITVSAGNNIKEGDIARMDIRVVGRNSDYLQNFLVNFNVVRSRGSLPIEFLSFPKEVSIDANTTVKFQIEIKNFSAEDIIIDRIEITGLAQNINYNTPQNISLASQERKTIEGSLYIGDIQLQPGDEILARIAFIGRDDVVIDKQLLLKIPELEKDEKIPERSKSTGFLTLSSSVLLGVILICISIILMFAMGVFKKKDRF
ncbi:MAG: hypothetical protein PHU47_00650 [Candidatus ainarchaeum sp.]|nr:hypothetical protein [Candidatus ainarchaeum sp.]